MKENDEHLVTGFIGTPYFCHALSDNGYLQEAYKLLLRENYPGWLYQVTKGATTIWEHWDGLKPDGTMWSPDMNSFNHYSYGSVGYWLYHEIVGIQPDPEAPGYTHFYLHPKISNALSFAGGTFESIHGKIESRWTIQGNIVDYQFCIPPNTTATVILDNAETILDSSAELHISQSKISGVVSSGSYRIAYQVI